jgi:site-specific DNA recombinase
MAGYYRWQVSALHELLERRPEIERMKASEILRSLVSAILLMPADDGLGIDVQGDLAGILAIATAQAAQNPGAFTSGMSQLKMVAGNCISRARQPLLIAV